MRKFKESRAGFKKQHGDEESYSRGDEVGEYEGIDEACASGSGARVTC